MTHNTSHMESTQYRACEMRLTGHDYPTIADAFDLTLEGALELVRTELKQRAALRDPETEYLLSLERLRRLLDAVKEKAEAGNEKAISLTIRILELWEGLKADHVALCAPKE